MANLIEKPLHVGKTDSYSLTVDSKWLNGEPITSAAINGDSLYISVGTTSIVGNVIYMYLTGVSPKGGSDIHISYTTPTRSDCDTISVIVKEC